MLNLGKTLRLWKNFDWRLNEMQVCDEPYHFLAKLYSKIRNLYLFESEKLSHKHISYSFELHILFESEKFLRKHKFYSFELHICTCLKVKNFRTNTNFIISSYISCFKVKEFHTNTNFKVSNYVTISLSNKVQ